MPTERQVLMTGAFCVWVVFCLSIVATALYVGAHFIAKFW